MGSIALTADDAMVVVVVVSEVVVVVTWQLIKGGVVRCVDDEFRYKLTSMSE